MPAIKETELDLQYELDTLCMDLVDIKDKVRNAESRTPEAVWEKMMGVDPDYEIVCDAGIFGRHMQPIKPREDMLRDVTDNDISKLCYAVEEYKVKIADAKAELTDLQDRDCFEWLREMLNEGELE